MISWLFGRKAAETPDANANDTTETTDTPANSPRDKDVVDVVDVQANAVPSTDAAVAKKEDTQEDVKEDVEDVPDTTSGVTSPQSPPSPQRQQEKGPPKFSHPLQEAADNKSIPDDAWFAMYEKYVAKDRPVYPIAPGMHPRGLSAAYLPHAHGGNAYNADAFQDDMPDYIRRLREVHCSGYVPPAEGADFHLRPVWGLWATKLTRKILLEAAELVSDD